jgi:hypothetical protein
MYGTRAEYYDGKFGQLAQDEWPKVLAFAQRHGIAEIQIDDPTLFAELGLGTTVQST